jgi:hypothetical protein
MDNISGHEVTEELDISNEVKNMTDENFQPVKSCYFYQILKIIVAMNNSPN